MAPISESSQGIIPEPDDRAADRETIRLLVEADESPGSCPYFARYARLPGFDPDAICDRGCVDEPACVTEEPEGGWPVVRARLRLAQAEAAVRPPWEPSERTLLLELRDLLIDAAPREVIGSRVGDGPWLRRWAAARERLRALGLDDFAYFPPYSPRNLD